MSSLSRTPPASGLSALALALLAGVLACLALPRLPSAIVLAATLVCGCGAAAALPRRFRACALIAVAGFSWTALNAARVLELRWPVEAAGARVLALATVESIPVAQEPGVHATARLRVERGGSAREITARLVWPHGVRPPRAGELWRVVVALQPPRGRVNPQGPDFERKLFSERVHALGRVVPSRLNAVVSDGHRPLAALRERIVRRIEGEVADRDAAALIAALAVGHTGGMSSEQWRVFNATGTTHLVAISGLHVTLFAIVAIALARAVWRVLARVICAPAREPFAATLGLASALGYALLAGFSVPTQRTLVMLAAWYGARNAARHGVVSMPIAAALVAVLALDPFAPLGAGFWLSFLAMCAIILATSTRIARDAAFAEAWRVQCVVAAVLAPVTLAWFGGASLVGLAVNLLAIPIVSFLFVPLVLLSVVLAPLAAVSDALLACAAAMHRWLWPWLTAAADLRSSLLFASPPPLWLIGAPLVALAAALPWPRVLRIAAVAWLVPLAAGGHVPRAGTLDVTMLDTGREAAVVLRSARVVIVHGIGEGYGTAGRSVENALLPHLRARGRGPVDALLLQRPNRRSTAGVNALLANARVAYVAVPRGGATFAGAGRCAAGRTWLDGAIAFRVSDESCALGARVGDLLLEVHDGAVVIRDVRGSAVLALHAGDPRGRTVQAARTLATHRSGAVTVTLGAAGVLDVRQWRADRPRLWRLALGQEGAGARAAPGPQAGRRPSV